MPVRPPFVENEIYHIYNRGVEKRDVFLEEQDYFLFVHNLFEFNDENPVGHLKNQTSNSQVGRKNKKTHHKPLIEVLLFVLMKNHFHLVVRQLTKNGIVKFMRKLGTGYTNFFNKKYNRVGPLFQGRFKAKLITNDSYLNYIPHYIHLNPLDYTFPNWREGRGVTDVKEAIEFLKKYRWSSLPDYIGKSNFPFVTERSFFLNLYGSTENYFNEIQNWIKKTEPANLQELFII